MLWHAVAVLLAALSSTPSEERIVFASDRAAALIRPAIYEVAAGGTTRRVSPFLRTIQQVVASPRGGRVAVVAGGDLYVSDRADTSLRRVTTRGDVSRPALSPSGESIAYVSRWMREAVVVTLADGAVRIVTSQLGPEVTGGVAWSPDGTRLVVPATGDIDHQNLEIHDLRSGVVTRLRESPVYDYAPAWSPDGRVIAFTFNNGLSDRDSVELYDVGTGRVRQVARYGHAPTWSPDGRYLAYTYYDELWVVAATGGAARKLVEFDNLRDEEPLSSVFAAWSPDSREIVAVVAGTLRAFRADGRGSRQLRIGRPRVRIVEYPDWSRGGAVLVPMQRYDPGDRDLYSVRPDGSGLRSLTANDDDETDPVLSPDGRRLAFSRCRIGFEEPRDCDVLLADADGGGARVLARGAASASWSPDSRSVAVVRPRRIDAVAVADGRERVLAHARALGGAEWSPDGRRLAYVHGRLYVVELGGRPRPLPEPAECNGDPAWSPAGSTIAFSSGECQDEFYPLFKGIFVTDAAGGRPRRLPRDTDEGEGDPAWSPDGKRLVVVQAFYGPDDRLRSRLVSTDLAGSGARTVYAGPGSAFAPDWGRAVVG